MIGVKLSNCVGLPDAGDRVRVPEQDITMAKKTKTKKTSTKSNNPTKWVEVAKKGSSPKAPPMVPSIPGLVFSKSPNKSKSKFPPILFLPLGYTAQSVEVAPPMSPEFGEVAPIMSETNTGLSFLQDSMIDTSDRSLGGCPAPGVAHETPSSTTLGETKAEPKKFCTGFGCTAACTGWGWTGMLKGGAPEPKLPSNSRAALAVKLGQEKMAKKAEEEKKQADTDLMREMGGMDDKGNEKVKKWVEESEFRENPQSLLAQAGKSSAADELMENLGESTSIDGEFSDLASKTSQDSLGAKAHQLASALLEEQHSSTQKDHEELGKAEVYSSSDEQQPLAKISKYDVQQASLGEAADQVPLTLTEAGQDLDRIDQLVISSPSNSNNRVAVITPLKTPKKTADHNLPHTPDHRLPYTPDHRLPHTPVQQPLVHPCQGSPEPQPVIVDCVSGNIPGVIFLGRAGCRNWDKRTLKNYFFILPAYEQKKVVTLRADHDCKIEYIFQQVLTFYRRDYNILFSNPILSCEGMPVSLEQFLFSKLEKTVFLIHEGTIPDELRSHQGKVWQCKSCDGAWTSSCNQITFK